MYLVSICYCDTTATELGILMTELFECEIEKDVLFFVENYITNFKKDLLNTFEGGDLEYIEDRFIFEYKIQKIQTN